MDGFPTLPDDWRDIFRSVLINYKIKGDQLSGPCPFHPDASPSFGLNVNTSQWICRAGCGEGNYFTFKKMLNDPSLIQPSRKPIENKREWDKEGHALKETYTYHDEFGAPLYQVLRYEPKYFSQRHLQCDGTWKPSIQGIKRYPYNLREIQKRSNELLWWVEGEKDVNNLTTNGCLATTSSGGSNGFQSEIISYLHNPQVLIIPDKDMTGHQYALKVKDAFNLLKPKTSIFMCDMPEAYKDVSEFFEAGKKISELKKYISVHAVIYPSQIEPALFFADRNIVIPDWHQKGNDRRQFIKEIYASIFNLIKDWHDIFNFQIDKIDQIASQTRDSDKYEKLINEFKILIEMKEFIDAIH